MKTFTVVIALSLSLSHAFSQNVFNTDINTNVGIGTSNPLERLQVTSATTGTSGVRLTNLTSLSATSPGNNRALGVSSNGTVVLVPLPNVANPLLNGQTFSSIADRNRKSQVLGMGSLLDASTNARSYNFLDFPTSNYNALSQVFFTIDDRSFYSRFRFHADAGGSSAFYLYNKLQEEIFKVQEDGSNNVQFYLPKANSRIIVGADATYLPQYKFVVRGNSKIEGDIITDSNVGIGTSSFIDGATTYRLSINGAVRAHSVKVYTSWADFVFDKSYELPSLSEVEAHIKQNGHLKDIPSAEVVATDGIDLGEMNKRLLQKIEELTLYVIDMNKEIEKLKSSKVDIVK